MWWTARMGILMVSQRVGARAPLHATGAGKLLLLNYSNQKLNEYIAVKGLRALTPHTLVTREALVNSLETIRSRGYALEDEERSWVPAVWRRRCVITRGGL